MKKKETLINNRSTSIDISPSEFKKLGYDLVDRIAELMETIRDKPVTTAESSEEIREVLNGAASLPEKGEAPAKIIQNAADLLINHSLYNGHPCFWGYITSSPAPLGILGDLLASAINPNVGARTLSPMASEIEAQTVRWIGELINYPENGGLLVSGGNVANYIGFIAGIRAKAGLGIRQDGINSLKQELIAYCSAETHTWIQKAADLYGLGTKNIRWIKTDDNQCMDVSALENSIKEDLDSGKKPFLVVGTAGSVSTGAIDPLKNIGQLCQKYNLWFHIDGAYGGFAACLPELSDEFSGLELADSIAIDPHKWLYSPLEAGCTLVKDPRHLTNAFSYHPPYYNFEQSDLNYVDYGIQNSRGFKALKVWLSLQQMGRIGYQQLIREDIALAEGAYQLFLDLPDFQSFTWNLSICTFRYVPVDLKESLQNDAVKEYLNDLNQQLLSALENSGQFFLSNAIISQNFILRMCIVNFRTIYNDVEALPVLLRNFGEKLDKEIRPDWESHIS